LNKVQSLDALVAGVGLFNLILDPADLHQLTDVGGTINNEMVNNSKLKTGKMQMLLDMLFHYNHFHIVISHMVRAIITLSSWAELLHQEFSHVRRVCLHIPENRMEI
jgi:hypothetical protein